MEKKILLASNGCMDKYKNSLGSFKNKLPKGHLPTHKKWKLGIESIGVHCRFLNEAVSKNNTHPDLIMFSRGYLIKKVGVDCLAFNNAPNCSKELTLDLFHPSQCYFINKDVSYDKKQLNEHFTQQTMMYHGEKLKKNYDYNYNLDSGIGDDQFYDSGFIGFPTAYDEKTEVFEIGQFGFSYMNEKLRAYILMHKTFFNHADLKAPSVKFYNKFTSADRKHDVTVDGQLYHWFLFSIYNKTNGESYNIK